MIRQWTIQHPTGDIDELETAYSFGPTSDLKFALKRLEIANSDCSCVDYDPNDTRPHILLTRLVPAPLPWEPDTGLTTYNESGSV